MNLKTIIFDFDGTLADTREAIVRAFRETVSDSGISCRRHPSVRELITIPLEDSFRIAGVSDPQRLAGIMAQYDRHFRSLAASLVAPFDGVLQVLATLSKSDLHLCVATNEIRENLDHLLEAFGISGLFDASVCADEVAAAKPAPDMVDRLLKALGGRPQETLVVGDSVLDLRMAKAAGCRTCAVSYGAHPARKLRKCGPDWLIDEFAQLLDIGPVAAAVGPVSSR